MKRNTMLNKYIYIYILYSHQLASSMNPLLAPSFAVDSGTAAYQQLVTPWNHHESGVRHLCDLRKMVIHSGPSYTPYDSREVIAQLLTLEGCGGGVPQRPPYNSKKSGFFTPSGLIEQNVAHQPSRMRGEGVADILGGVAHEVCPRQRSKNDSSSSKS